MPVLPKLFGDNSISLETTELIFQNYDIMIKSACEGGIKV